MNRPLHIWLAFALCASLAVAAMAWLTREAIRADLDRTLASRRAELEQNVSLVLWRMDSKLAPLIAEEVARPPEFFQSGTDLSSVPTSLPKHVIMNFTCPSVGECASPQVPDESQEQMALAAGYPPQLLAINKTRLKELSTQVTVDDLLKKLPKQTVTTRQIQSRDAADNSLFWGNYLPVDKSKTEYASELDLAQRGKRYQDVAQQEFRKQRADLPSSQEATQVAAPPASAPAAQAAAADLSVEQVAQSVAESVAQSAPQSTVVTPRISEGLSRPIWVGDNLLLARRIVQDGETSIQGTWLDWPGLRTELLAEANHILPNASLRPVNEPDNEDPTRMLAGLPVVFDSGENLVVTELSRPMKWALGIGWGALALALASSAILLAGVVSLSERRAAFVSSVTHELRTPLTTFRMYSDMLARNIVPEGSRRQEYLETLRREAERLTHLVENVLSYARLERGRAIQRCETVTAKELVDRFRPRLAERTEQAGMELAVSVADDAPSAKLETDVGVVEQILFNLVDNAAKYAQCATDRRVHFDVARDASDVTFTIRDHGPGFAKPSRARHARPFSKSAEEAAATAPGVGLGLALCRRLAKQLGGCLEVKSYGAAGTEIALTLPTSMT